MTCFSLDLQALPKSGLWANVDGGGRGFPARFAPDREAEEGTSARPGRRVQLTTPEAAAQHFRDKAESYAEDVKVCTSTILTKSFPCS